MGNRQVVERYAEALASGDLDAQGACLHDDYEARWPQSGEVTRGRENRRAIIENYPGGAIIGRAKRIVGSDDQFVTGPSWNIIHLQGSGDDIKVTGLVDYPDGSTWHFVTLFTMREGKIWRQVDYYAPPFEAPEWRAPFVDIEPMQER